MIRQIFISNVLESYYRTYEKLDDTEKKYWIDHDFREANRAYLYGGNNKIVITSLPVNTKNSDLINKSAGYENVINLYPRQPSYSISEDCMKDNLSDQIINIIKENPGIEVVPYRNTKEFYNFIDALKKFSLEFTTPETIDTDNRFVIDYLGSKRGFRHIFEKCLANKGLKFDIQIPEGYITSDRNEAIEASWWLARKGSGVVIKYNKGMSGVGLLMFKLSNLPKQKDKFKKYLESEMLDDIWKEPTIIVEELIDVDENIFSGSPNVELLIDKNGNIKKSYSCEQVLADDAKTFLGIYINPKVSNSVYMKIGFEVANEFGNEIKNLRYRGIFDMDFVISRDAKLYAVESNLRRTGGTHIHEYCQNLLGTDYFNKYYVLSEDIHLKERFTYEDFMQTFEGFKYDKARKEGFLLFNADMLEVNILSIMYIARSEEELKRIRNEIKSKI